MPRFEIIINPAVRTSYGSTQIVSTSTLKRAKVDCQLDELTSVMRDEAYGLKSPIPEAPLIHVYATPQGRPPNGFKAFQARSQNKLLIEASDADSAAPALLTTSEVI